MLGRGYDAWRERGNVEKYAYEVWLEENEVELLYLYLEQYETSEANIYEVTSTKHFQEFARREYKSWLRR